MFLRLIPAIPCGQALVVMPASGNLQFGVGNGSYKAQFSLRIAADFSWLPYLCNKNSFETYLSQKIFEIEATEFHGYEFTK
jgi:hypothetical protein